MGYFKHTATIALICLSAFAASTNGAAKSETKKSDVRLLIDISGSMKQNDPNNLRIPALQLVTNLLPKGSDAGVWAFGRYVNMMVPLSTVDAKWQINATNTATKINSSGLFTNIGSVLQKASYGWNSPSSSEKRSMILLTDGMVDISKDPAVNAKERIKILKEVLPKLKMAGVAIHTIALSENADHELLRELSRQTDGWYESVNSPEELQKVFLKIFEQAAARDRLPISDNQFSVDSSIDEMTVLVFRKAPSSSTKLVSPAGNSLNKDSTGSNVRWFSTDGYDLVTLQKPQAGQWKIDADVDPDNRVMVVSKLGLSVSEIPNNLLAGEAINYQFELLEEGKKITNQDFLNLVDARLQQDKAGQKSKMAMFYDGANHSFKQNFYTDSYEGELKLELLVKSPTFERVRNHAINIYGSPLIAEVEKSSDNLAPHKIHFQVREDIVQAENIKINATIAMPDGEKIFQGVTNLNEPMEIAATLAGGHYTVELKISGRSVLNRPFDVTPEAIAFDAISLLIESTPEPAIEQSVKEEKQAPKESPELIDPAEKPEPEGASEDETKPAEEESGVNWLYMGLGINFVLIILGYFGWRFIKKRNSKGVADLANELSIDEDDDEQNVES